MFDVTPEKAAHTRVRTTGLADTAGEVAEFLQSALAVDGVLIDLRRCAELQPNLDVPGFTLARAAVSNAIFATLSDEQLHQISEPTSHARRGFRLFACLPIVSDEKYLLGRLTVFDRAERELAEADLKMIRQAAQSIADAAALLA